MFSSDQKKPSVQLTLRFSGSDDVKQMSHNLETAIRWRQHTDRGNRFYTGTWSGPEVKTDYMDKRCRHSLEPATVEGDPMECPYPMEQTGFEILPEFVSSGEGSKITSGLC